MRLETLLPAPCAHKVQSNCSCIPSSRVAAVIIGLDPRKVNRSFCATAGVSSHELMILRKGTRQLQYGTNINCNSNYYCLRDIIPKYIKHNQFGHSALNEKEKGKRKKEQEKANKIKTNQTDVPRTGRDDSSAQSEAPSPGPSPGSTGSIDSG